MALAVIGRRRRMRMPRLSIRLRVHLFEHGRSRAPLPYARRHARDRAPRSSTSCGRNWPSAAAPSVIIVSRRPTPPPSCPCRAAAGRPESGWISMRPDVFSLTSLAIALDHLRLRMGCRHAASPQRITVACVRAPIDGMASAGANHRRALDELPLAYSDSHGVSPPMSFFLTASCTLRARCRAPCRASD